MEFKGKRLRMARLYRNMSITDLEAHVTVSKQAISQYEKDEITPKVDVVLQFVKVLGFPLGFFTSKNLYNFAAKNNTFFRASATTKKLDLDTQEIKIEMIIFIYNFLKNYLDMPAFNLPRIDKIDDFDSMAQEVRNLWGVYDRPIENMVNLLERNGIIVSALDVQNKKIDAFTQMPFGKEEQFCVVLGNDKQSMVRRNFDAAHELGHIVMHRDMVVKDLAQEEYKAMEQEANLFAASFLLPHSAFDNDLSNPLDLNSYVLLKKKWKVSIAAMIMRARALGRISNFEYQALMKKRSYRKWIACEPFDKEWKLQEPTLFKKAIKILLDNGMSGDKILFELSKSGLTLNASDFEELLSLPKGMLDVIDEPELKLRLVK
ncbi:XRE family transcriptional regulator [Christensenella tenuis]|uniref:ImmA/IrrE family metallo-endopeptidase n=1 Tax=Christensenella tenuis TaxID=2763033 RepID=A0ABR7EDJ3_9FIRM|nr:XRE family transcriptional regulator [Christensenella tenuis]MBC5647849.1 ImmA/IrrE family metallo-endopeptidase [Christensenella tenuis]